MRVRGLGCFRVHVNLPRTGSLIEDFSEIMGQDFCMDVLCGVQVDSERIAGELEFEVVDHFHSQLDPPGFVKINQPQQ